MDACALYGCSDLHALGREVGRDDGHMLKVRQHTQLRVCNLAGPAFVFSIGVHDTVTRFKVHETINKDIGDRAG